MSNSKSGTSLLGGVSDAGDNAILQDLFLHIHQKRGHLLNIHRVVAFAPKMLRAQAAYAAAIREDSSLPRDLQEILILRVAQINHSEYEQSVHVPIALKCGVSHSKLAEIQQWQNSKYFNTREKAALSFTEEMVLNARVDDEVFATALENFSKEILVEIAVLVAWYVGNTHFTRALELRAETKHESPMIDFIYE